MGVQVTHAGPKKRGVLSWNTFQSGSLENTREDCQVRINV